jgi:16S rRNA processing protein RimM
VGGAQDRLAAGRVGRPHGLDGSFHVVDARPALLPLGATVRAGDRDAEVVRRAGTDERPIVRLEGVETRDAAEALRGTELLVPRSVAPPLEADEWWAEDLEGCRVVDGERELGRVARLLALPSCEVLEVTGEGEAEPFLVPLVRDAVRQVDVGAKVIDIDVAFLGDTAPAGLATAAAAPSDAPSGARGRRSAAPSEALSTSPPPGTAAPSESPSTPPPPGAASRSRGR